MKIRDMMTRNPITVQPETLVLDARKIMKEKNIRRLPVVEKGKLVGIVTKYDLLEASPSSATSLSVYELNYLLAKLQVREIMTRDPVTVTPETPFEEALQIGKEKKIGSFPVVEKGKLVGITTESDILRYLIQALGIGKEGSRITIVASEGNLEEMNRMLSIIKSHGFNVLGMFSLLKPTKKKGRSLTRKINDHDSIRKDLRKIGITVA